MKITAEQIASIINATIVGDAQRTVSNFAKIEEAKQEDLSFLANPKYLKYLESTEASVLILSKRFYSSEKPSTTILLVEDAYSAFTQLLQAYQNIIEGSNRKTGIHPTAVIEEDSKISPKVYIGAMVYVGNKVEIGEDTTIHPQVYIGDGVKIGSGCTFHAGAKILAGSEIGNNVILHAGVVVGSDGFGFAPDNQGVYSKIPQLGTVFIGNDVEIGANTTIDRATMGKTIIADGVKIDNLVQIAHNVSIDSHTVIAAQAGISGSTKIGKHCIVGGQAGIVGHIELANGTRINAQSGVSKSVKESNKALTGSPAFDYYQSIKSQAIIRQLPSWIERIKILESKEK